MGRLKLGSLGWLVLSGGLLACEDASPAPQRSDDAGTSVGATPDAESARDPAIPGQPDGGAPGALTYQRDVSPIRREDEARPGTFIPPYEDCRDPAAGQTGAGAGGKVCTNVAISGATEPGKRFADYADCAIVRRQRPYWTAPPARASKPDDPRLMDAAYLRESAWASEQIAATGCACCHDGRLIAASQWDISLGPLWLDSLSDTGLALFTGLADSSVLGAYPAAENHGFDRAITGIPSTDSVRMKAIMLAELTRRGLNEDWARAVPPFGGPIYTASVQKPAACDAGQGIDLDGSVRWTGGDARYVYVLEPGSKNPGVPPNLDLPAGTLWRLDVRASEAPLASGVQFGTTPPGSFQVEPASKSASALVRDKSYQLVVLRDVGLPLVNCLFTFGTPVAPVSATDAQVPSAPLDAGSGYPPVVSDAGSSEAGSPDAGGRDASAAMCTQSGGDARGFGAPCNDTTNHSDCPCAANYCSKSPFDTVGYCSVIGCKENPSICPTGWSCFDVSQFAPGQPAVCARP